MNLTSIQKTIIDIWQFIFPPILTVFFLFLIAYIVTGPYMFVPFEKLASYSFSLIQDENNQQLIGFYGINKLMPIILIFIVISVLYLSMIAVRNIGNVLPVTMIYDPDKLFLHIDNSNRLARIWSYFPNVQTFGNLRTIIQERSYIAEKELEKPFIGIKSWESTSGRHVTSFITLKFLLLWTLVCFVIALFVGKPLLTTLLKSIIISIIVLMAAIYCGAQFYYATEQLTHCQLIAVDAMVCSKQESKNKSGDSNIEKYRKLISREKDKNSRSRWWEIQVVNKYFYEWTYRTFLKDR